MSKSTNGELRRNRIPDNEFLAIATCDFKDNIDMEILELSMLEEAYRTNYPANLITNNK